MGQGLREGTDLPTHPKASQLQLQEVLVSLLMKVSWRSDPHAQPQVHDVRTISDASTDARTTITCGLQCTCSSSFAETHCYCIYAGADFDDNFGFEDGGEPDVGAAAYNSYAPAPYQPDPQQGFDGAQTSPGAVQPPEILNCTCGLQCSYIMAKTAKNDGRWFYRSVKLADAGCL